MNEKLTREQRVMAKKVKDIIGMYFHPLPHWKPEDWYDHEAIAAELLEILTAHTEPEDEVTPQELYLRKGEEIVSRQEDECERCKHLENKFKDWSKRFTKKADELIALQVKTTWGNTEPEDELIINDWDDCWHSIGQCGNPECWRCTLDTTEITLRKIEEYIKILSINPISNRIRINTMLDCKDWLQQEGKKSLGYYPDGQPVEDTCPRCGGKWKKAWKKEKQKQWQVDMCQDCGKER